MFYKDDRLAIFIDGPNFYSSTRALGIDVDFGLLKNEFSRRGKLLRAIYYTTKSENDEFSAIRPLSDWLDYNGFLTVTKPIKEFTDSIGRRRTKGTITIDLAVDALEIARHIDHAVIFSGDSEFVALIKGLQRMGVRVSVASTVKTNPPVVADELRRQADSFIELEALREVIGRPSKELLSETI